LVKYSVSPSIFKAKYKYQLPQELFVFFLNIAHAVIMEICEILKSFLIHSVGGAIVIGINYGNNLPIFFGNVSTIRGVLFLYAYWRLKKIKNNDLQDDESEKDNSFVLWDFVSL